MSDSAQCEWRFYIDDMIGFAETFSALRGTRKTGMSTDEIMNLLRGYG